MSTCRKQDAPKVDFKAEKLCFYYSDFYEGNFIFTDSGEICLIDFDKAGFLPQSFMVFALAESHWAPGNWIEDIIMSSLPKGDLEGIEKNLKAMRHIFYYLAIGCRVGESGKFCPLYNLVPSAQWLTSNPLCKVSRRERDQGWNKIQPFWRYIHREIQEERHRAVQVNSDDGVQ